MATVPLFADLLHSPFSLPVDFLLKNTPFSSGSLFILIMAIYNMDALHNGCSSSLYIKTNLNTSFSFSYTVSSIYVMYLEFPEQGIWLAWVIFLNRPQV